MACTNCQLLKEYKGVRGYARACNYKTLQQPNKAISLKDTITNSTPVWCPLIKE